MRASQERRRKRASRLMVAIAASVLIAFCIMAILAPVIAPYEPTLQTLTDRLVPPGSDGYLLGTDALGRDVWSRLLYGARISLAIGFATVALTAVVGVAIGLVSGYIGGRLDSIVMRIIDVWLAFPFLLLAIALVAVLGRGIEKLILALVLAGWPAFARPVRGEVLQLREREYILSARALGVQPVAVMLQHLLPNILPTILVISALDIGSTILSLASLSFLGLGMGAETATWGGMLADGRNYVASAWWLAVFPGVAIFSVVMAVNLVGDWLRDRYDPRSPFRNLSSTEGQNVPDRGAAQSMTWQGTA